MELKEKLKERLLNLDELKDVDGGTYYESWEIVEAIDSNPNLWDLWDAALDECCQYEFESEDQYLFVSALTVLDRIGIDSTFYGDNGSGFSNRYTNKTTFLNMSHAQVLHILRTYK